MTERILDNCIFCKIAAKQIPAKLAYEDEELLAFHDINPAAPVHLLIVPKKHIASLADCAPEDAGLIGRMSLLAPKLAAEHGCGFTRDADGAPAGGFKTQFHVGPDGGQEVYHLHMHVLGGPRPWRAQR
jgi:histidine triad (HIT) family protein